MGILEHMEASAFSIAETQCDKTSPNFCKFIRETINKENQYSKVEMSSNRDEHYEKIWKPGGIMLGVSGK